MTENTIDLIATLVDKQTKQVADQQKQYGDFSEELASLVYRLKQENICLKNELETSKRVRLDVVDCKRCKDQTSATARKIESINSFHANKTDTANRSFAAYKETMANDHAAELANVKNECKEIGNKQKLCNADMLSTLEKHYVEQLDQVMRTHKQEVEQYAEREVAIIKKHLQEKSELFTFDGIADPPTVWSYCLPGGSVNHVTVYETSPDKAIVSGYNPANGKLCTLPASFKISVCSNNRWTEITPDATSKKNDRTFNIRWNKTYQLCDGQYTVVTLNNLRQYQCKTAIGGNKM